MTRTGAREKKKRGASAPSCRMELRRLGVVGQRPEGEGVQGPSWLRILHKGEGWCKCRSALRSFKPNGAWVASKEQGLTGTRPTV